MWNDKEREFVRALYEDDPKAHGQFAQMLAAKEGKRVERELRERQTSNRVFWFFIAILFYAVVGGLYYLQYTLGL